MANSKLATGSVTTNKLADQNVTTAKVADAAITFAKLGSDANQVIPAGLGPVRWSGATLPLGWDWADGGVLLSDTPYPTLRARYIADGFPFGQYGSGNPKKPDARGAVIAGVDGGAGRLTSATILGGALLGKRGGAETVPLSLAQLPTGITSNGSNAISVTTNRSDLDLGLTPSSTGGGQFGFNSASGSGAVTSTGSNSISVTSNNTGGQAHNNVQPTLVCNMIIKAH
ncbi:hypothetical protein [Bradyrhizobium sp. CB2312]|uniref:hypothetical protein n=1 Tax=Bradyrhizobium sp. CB2312 TaxID=3039155 RepID=UPI0024B1CBA8|nr:hypothetical protein [Bradyrhizobium sp. CB2312]WFU76609.1 hypothetical protein QA642_22675 [Bradyrhizobium sp. CB2312]